MSVIIRLQNLPWSANALDIRQFFQGLSIPEGGVHIVGGEQGDAFIAFSTDEDARQAMMHNGGKLKEVQVSLLLSSRSEMQKVIDTARQKVLGMQAASATPAAPAAPIAPVMPAVQPVQQPAIPTITPAIPNITAPQLAQQMGLPMQAQLPVQQRLLGMLGMGMAAQLNNLQQNSMPLATAAAHSNNPLMHPHLTMQQQQQHQHHQQTMLPHHQAPNPMMQAQLNQMRPNLPMNNQNQLHQQQQQQQMHHQQQQQHQVNERPGRDGRPDRRRSRSRSRDRKRSRDRRDRGGGSSRRRRSRSRSRDRDKNRRRDRSKSRERSRDHNRDSRDRRKDDRKSSRDEKPARGKDDANNVSKNSQQGPTPWVSPSANAPAGPTMSRFSPYQPNNNSQQGDGPVWGQQKQPFNSPPAQQPPHNNSQSNGSGPQQPPRRAPQQNTCVQVSNMPQSVVYRDLREFFQQLHVLNIKLITDEKGHKQGRALIKFGSTECKLKAMTMTGSMYNGTHRIEVKHCTEEEYDRTLDSFTPSQEPAVVAINNIPPYANEMDVKRVFHGARIFNVVLMHPGDKTGIPSGFVQFSTMSEKNRAIAASGKLKIDNQEIFVSDSSFEEIFKAQKALRNSSSSSSINSESPVKMKEDLPAVGVSPVLSECVLLKGLPLTANNREILDFFSDVGLIPLHIYIMQDDKGAPAGDAFCEFRNPAEGVRAVAKNKSTLGTKEITVRPVLRQEMEMALGMAKNPNQMMPRNGQDQMRHSMRPNFMNRPQFDPRNPQMFPMRGPFPRGPFPPHMMGNRPRPPFMNGPPQEPNIEFGKPGCVVEVTNVPYQADIDEILNFFSDFELTRQDVIRRFNDMGKPTGDLRIAFHSPQDAQRALALKFKKMRDRQLYMNLLQT